MSKKHIIAGVIFILILAAFAVLVFKITSEIGKINGEKLSRLFQKISSPIPSNTETVKKFSSKEDFLAYLKKAKDKTGFPGMWGRGGAMTAEDQAVSAPSAEGLLKSAIPERVSQTNVQVSGIDEPDIVKTDGKNIYFSSESNWIYGNGPMPLMERGISIPEIYPAPLPPDFEKPKTKVISAFPVDKLGKISEIEKNGNLLLAKEKNILVVFSSQEIFAYDVTDPKSPKEKWNLKLEDKTALVGERFYSNKIYLVIRNYLDERDPCPLKPLTSGSETIEIACGEIYHPEKIIPADVSFSVLVINPASGKVENKTSFVGSTSSSLVYMSENAVYVTYTYVDNLFGYLADAISDTGKDILPGYIIEKLNKVKSYDISDEAKMTEFQKITEDYKRTLSNDEELRIENEMQNKMQDYFKEHSRELEKTGIVKVNINGLNIVASGNIPGHLLNQFSLDEHKNNLRVATSIGGGFWGWGTVSNEANMNDVYVLSDKLEIIGAIKDLGITERIYSARFLGDRGYLVTFRQTDPFYVLDLSDPRKPVLKGELKIPGFSSYLHPIADNIILGVGQESGKVKLSLFDVGNASDPREIDKYLLDEYWSEAQSNHHAFLQDAKHEVFFLPGGKGGYVFSYAENKLNLKKAVSDYQVKRALYINDFLYIIGEKEISVLDERSWEKVKELSL
ncbi:MAG: beta-propeller domain-containing protein [Candidatus Moranbacteria bacterium]|nr:beta-propeller domain-containing protein [Candidatus Moranbacteria bacterium]